MGLLDTYQDSTENTLRVMATQAVDLPPAKPKQSAWSAPFRAVASGIAETAGNVVDVAGAFGQTASAAGGLTPGFDPDQKKNRQAAVDAMDALKTDGINWRTDEAQQAYRFGADLRPDPITAGTAENLVFGLTKGLTKAIGAAVTLGPVAGAGAFGASEGMTTSEDLAAQGVDQATRAKVGIVTGGLSALGVALPVAGQTLRQTAGLLAIGGPGSFIAQQAATREILRGADYKALAEQYDPLDPAGLAVATLLPAGFAAYAKRGALRSSINGRSAGDGSATMQEAAMTATPEAIDAAMVQNLTARADVRPAIERADLLRAWDDVHQNPIGPENDPLVRLTPDNVADVLVSRGPVSLKDDGVSIKVPGYGLVKFIWRHGPESTKPESGQVNAEDLADFPYIMRNLEPTISETNGIEQMTWTTERPDGRLVVFGTTRFQHDGEHHLVTVHVDEKRLSMPSPERKEPPTTSGRGALQASRLDTAGESFASSSPEVDGGYKQSIGGDRQDVTPDAYRARVDQLVNEQPDLIARLDDAGQPVKLSDELAQIRKAAQEGSDADFGALDAPLLKVAAECALSIGTAAL